MKNWFVVNALEYWITHKCVELDLKCFSFYTAVTKTNPALCGINLIDRHKPHKMCVIVKTFQHLLVFWYSMPYIFLDSKKKVWTQNLITFECTLFTTVCIAPHLPCPSSLCCLVIQKTQKGSLPSPGSGLQSESRAVHGYIVMPCLKEGKQTTSKCKEPTTNPLRVTTRGGGGICDITVIGHFLPRFIPSSRTSCYYFCPNIAKILFLILLNWKPFKWLCLIL